MQATLEGVREVFHKGGPVMYPLLALSIITLALILERTLFWVRTHPPGRRQRVIDVADRLRAGDEPGARAIASADGSIYSRIVSTLLSLPPSDTLGIELVERYRHSFERFTMWLSTAITAGPLLGILGSVSGIIRSLGLLGGASRTSSLEAAALGISEALITTAFGLAIALVTIFPYMLFRGHIDRAIGSVEILAAARIGSSRK